MLLILASAILGLGVTPVILAQEAESLSNQVSGGESSIIPVNPQAPPDPLDSGPRPPGGPGGPSGPGEPGGPPPPPGPAGIGPGSSPGSPGTPDNSTTPAESSASAYQGPSYRIPIYLDPVAGAREQGAELFSSNAPSMNRVRCVDCHNPSALARMTRDYPRFNSLRRDVLTLSEAIETCADRWMRGWHLPDGSPQSIAIRLYLKSLR